MYTKYKIVPFCPYHFVRTILSNTILSVYHFVHTILSVPFCPLPFCPIPFCPYTILSVYHFVRTILSATILSGHGCNWSREPITTLYGPSMSMLRVIRTDYHTGRIFIPQRPLRSFTKPQHSIYALHCKGDVWWVG